MATRFLLEGHPQQLMVFEATANGKPARMFLDTGACVVLFGDEGAANLNIAIAEETVDGYGAGGAIELKMAELPEMEIDGRLFPNLQVLVSDQVDMAAAQIGISLDGVAGYPLFSDSTLDIDFENSQLSLTGERLEGGLPFDLNEQTPLVIVQGEIAGAAAMIAIDTGASVTTVSMETGSKVADQLVISSELTGAGGQIESYEVPPIEIRIGGACVMLDAVRASPFVASLSETHGLKIDAVLGLDWLKWYRVKFDYVSRRVSFE